MKSNTLPPLVRDWADEKAYTLIKVCTNKTPGESWDFIENSIAVAVRQGIEKGKQEQESRIATLEAVNAKYREALDHYAWSPKTDINGDHYPVYGGEIARAALEEGKS